MENSSMQRDQSFSQEVIRVSPVSVVKVEQSASQLSAVNQIVSILRRKMAHVVITSA